MQVIKQVLSDALLVRAPRFEDSRGAFEVFYESNTAFDAGLREPFVQDNQSTSNTVGTIRGFHLQLPPFEQGKLVRVLRGRIMDVIVDLRPGSVTFGAHTALELDDSSGDQLWVPRGFGHAFCTLELMTTVFYKVDSAYEPAAERNLAWNDPTVGADWPDWLTEPVLSEKDAAGLSFEEITAEIRGGLG